MKKPLIARLFLLFALALCLVPSVGLLINGPAAPRANEAAASPPSLTDRDGALNADYLSELADYAGEGFYLRGELITLYARALSLFGRSAEDGVVLGTDGWLYYADELPDYSGTEPMTGRELFSTARNLSLMREYCESLGADFLFFIAPNKSSLYPAHMPSSYPVSEAESNASRLHAALEGEGVEFIDLFALFGTHEEELYFAHDSHWNSRGAAAAADALCAALGRESAYFSGPFGAAESHSGDLFEMLYPAAEDAETDTPPAGLEFIQGDNIRPDSITIDTESAGDGSLLMFRDSFGELLYPYLAAEFGSARFSRQAAYDLTTAASLGSDTVVIELVERNLRYLIDYAATFPAPEREIDPSSAADTGESVPLEAEEASGGLLRVTGALPGACDDDSPVYIARGGAVYEASLLADGGFTACLGGGDGEITVLYYEGGELRGCSAAI